MGTAAQGLHLARQLLAELQAIRRVLEAAHGTTGTSTGQTWPVDCGCMPGQVCHNAVCPRASRVTS